MYGLEAIEACNGWSMALVGASIVFTGLVVLSLAISQLKKVIAYIEDKQMAKESAEKQPAIESAIKESPSMPPDHPLEDLDQAVLLYKPIFEKLGETFQLSDLYNLTQERNFPHPHLTIKLFRRAQILVPVGDGNFTLNQ